MDRTGANPILDLLLLFTIVGIPVLILYLHRRRKEMQSPEMQKELQSITATVARTPPL